MALKRIKLNHATDKDKRARFVVEAEITGRLEHPGIVPVYGLGTYDDGRGETQDALAVIAYGRKRWPGAALWLGGFSFGGSVAVWAAGEARPARLVAVAPGITKIGVTGAAAPACPWLIVQGDADEVVPPKIVLAWTRTLVPAPEVVVLPGAGHFFHGRINDLRETVVAFMGRAAA